MSKRFLSVVYQSWVLLAIALAIVVARVPVNISTQKRHHILAPGRVSLGPTEAPEGYVEIVADVSSLTLTLLVNGKPYKKYPIAIGKWHTPTPVGEFTIIEKYFEPGGPFGSRWMGLNVPWGGYGIHGTNSPSSIGWAASAGCMRMYNHDVEELFEWVPIGTKVTIMGYEPDRDVSRDLYPGDVGQDVQYVQYRLRQMGFDPGPMDGWFGRHMESALKQFQIFYDLSPTGLVTEDELRVLGIR